jgi:hypothetical protein
VENGAPRFTVRVGRTGALRGWIPMGEFRQRASRGWGRA